jgi:hypothetical protein
MRKTFYFWTCFFAFFPEKCLTTVLSTGSEKGKEEGPDAIRARVENMQAIRKRNVVRANIMVAPLDFVAEIIQANHWGYLYNCACLVYPRFVRDFYRHLEVVQDDDSEIIL